MAPARQLTSCGHPSLPPPPPLPPPSRRSLVGPVSVDRLLHSLGTRHQTGGRSEEERFGASAAALLHFLGAPASADALAGMAPPEERAEALHALADLTLQARARRLGGAEEGGRGGLPAPLLG